MGHPLCTVSVRVQTGGGPHLTSCSKTHQESCAHLPATLLLSLYEVIMTDLCLSVVCASLRGQSTDSLGVVTCLCSAGKEAGVFWTNSVHS